MKSFLMGLSMLFTLTGCVVVQPQVELAPSRVVLPSAVEVPASVTQVLLPAPVLTVTDVAHVQLTEVEITCIATAMIAEAGGESETGMVGVGYVIVNRVGAHTRNPRHFRSTACGVVYQRDRTRSGKSACQFSWVCHPTGRHYTQHPRYSRARILAQAVIEGSIDNPVDDSIFFNVRRLRPAHTRGLPLRAQIGNHNFFAAG